jgi:anti-anti-sigma factor
MTTIERTPDLSIHRDQLHYEVHQGADVCVVRLEGSFRMSTAPVIGGLVEQLAHLPRPSLIVDASLLWEIDAVGVDVLTDLQQAVLERGGKMMVYAASGPVARALDGSPLRQ